MSLDNIQITAASINECTVNILIDNSGSMCDIKHKLLEGLNVFFEKLISTGAEFKYTVATFNNSLKYLCKNKSSKEFEKFEEYETYGSTALYDSINEMIESQLLIKANNCIFYVLTDGLDNISINTNSDFIKQKIDKLKKNNNWNFILTGAEINSNNLGNEIGINNTKNFEKKDITKIMNEVSYSISRCISGEQDISELKLDEPNINFDPAKITKQTVFDMDFESSNIITQTAAEIYYEPPNIIRQIASDIDFEPPNIIRQIASDMDFEII